MSTTITSNSQAAALPLPQVVSASECGTNGFVVVTAIDDRGRLSSREPIRYLGWESLRHVNLSIFDGVIVARAAGARSGSIDARIDRRGFLRLRAETARCIGASTGRRVLVVSNSESNLLLICGPARLSELLEALVSDYKDGHE